MPTCATTARWSSPTRSRLWCGGRNFAAEYFEGDPDRRVEPSARPQLRSAPARSRRAPASSSSRTGRTRRGASRSSGARRPRTRDRRSTRRSRSSCRADPSRSTTRCRRCLLSGCFRAEQRLLVVTPYFIPDASLLMGLALAARRGVQVDIVLPRRSNHRLADVARHRPLRELAAAGARLWFTPFMLHAKVVVVDDQLALAGSANLDLRSLFLNYELMVAFYEPCRRRAVRGLDRRRAAARRALPAKRARPAARPLGGSAALAGVPAVARTPRSRVPSGTGQQASAACTIASASTSKWRRKAARVSLRPKPSVPSVTQRRPGGRKARICSGTART